MKLKINSEEQKTNADQLAEASINSLKLDGLNYNQKKALIKQYLDEDAIISTLRIDATKYNDLLKKRNELQFKYSEWQKTGGVTYTEKGQPLPAAPSPLRDLIKSQFAIDNFLENAGDKTKLYSDNIKGYSEIMLKVESENTKDMIAFTVKSMIDANMMLSALYDENKRVKNVIHSEEHKIETESIISPLWGW